MTDQIALNNLMDPVGDDDAPPQICIALSYINLITNRSKCRNCPDKYEGKRIKTQASAAVSAVTVEAVKADYPH
jgi:hypothetical protein